MRDGHQPGARGQQLEELIHKQLAGLVDRRHVQ